MDAETALLLLLKEHQIEPTAIQLQQLEQYYQLLIEWNKKMNLTAITDKHDVYIKHFYDSMIPTFMFDFNTVNTVCDVGSGAGFPSLVMKIMFPDIQVTIIEALNKRISFLQEVVTVLDLQGVTFVHGRAEDMAVKYREQFDIVTARAVARLPILSELCVPLVKVGGQFLVMKGEQGDTEYQEAKQALKILGIGTTRREEICLTNQTNKRIIYFCQKIIPTPKRYPRIFGQIKKKPL